MKLFFCFLAMSSLACLTTTPTEASSSLLRLNSFESHKQRHLNQVARSLGLDPSILETDSERALGANYKWVEVTKPSIRLSVQYGRFLYCQCSLFPLLYLCSFHHAVLLNRWHVTSWGTVGRLRTLGNAPVLEGKTHVRDGMFKFRACPYGLDGVSQHFHSRTHNLHMYLTPR